VSEAGRVEGKAALVTGASSGLGRATAIALAKAGADVALAARSKEELESAKEEVSKLGRRALTLPVDLASETETAEAVGRTVEALGRIDILVNAAGTDAPGVVEDLRRRTRPHARREPQGALFAVEGGLPAHARGGRRHDRQHLFGGGKEGLGERLGLLRL
jgi:NADP-dependent 3-hydroxy acid dehydrogenase YdfG